MAFMNETDLDTLMDHASELLVQRDYLECERLCEKALSMARANDDYDRIARILLPLQEARRQRRQIAADAGVHVYDDEKQPLQDILNAHDAGCILLIAPPYTPDDAAELRKLARESERYLEVICIDAMRMRGLFLDAQQAIGDAELAWIARAGSPREQLDQLLNALPRLADHEIAHQRAAELARQIQAAQG